MTTYTFFEGVPLDLEKEITIACNLFTEETRQRPERLMIDALTYANIRYSDCIIIGCDSISEYKGMELIVVPTIERLIYPLFRSKVENMYLGLGRKTKEAESARKRLEKDIPEEVK